MQDDVEVQMMFQQRKMTIFTEVEPAIKSLAEAMKMAEQLRHLAQFHGHQRLALSDLQSHTLKLQVPKWEPEFF